MSRSTRTCESDLVPRPAGHRRFAPMFAIAFMAIAVEPLQYQGSSLFIHTNLKNLPRGQAF